MPILAGEGWLGDDMKEDPGNNNSSLWKGGLKRLVDPLLKKRLKTHYYCWTGWFSSCIPFAHFREDGLSNGKLIHYYRMRYHQYTGNLSEAVDSFTVPEDLVILMGNNRLGMLQFMPEILMAKFQDSVIVGTLISSIPLISFTSIF